MSLALTRRFGVAILACLAAISSVRGQGTTAVPRKIGVTDAAPAPADPSPQEETESSPDDFFASLGVYIEPDVMALAEIGRRMRLSIKQMPNYTCLQSIRREKSRPGRRAERSVDWLPVSSDTVKIDVAFVDGSELYSWPGARRFDETSLPDLVGFGMVSTGNFASIGRALFLDQSGLFSHVGEVDFEGRRALRYDFRVPLFGSGYSIHHDKGEVTVEYSGSIWADAGSKDLIRIETRVEDAPPPLLVSRVISHLDYERVRIGGKDFQLPKRAYLETHFKMGGRNHNEIEFSNCRQFGAQSELSFAESGGEADLTSLSATEEFSLPSGVSVALRLATTIDSATASAGDQLRATLTQAVEQDGNLLLPKGAIVTGRLPAGGAYLRAAQLLHHRVHLRSSRDRNEVGALHCDDDGPWQDTGLAGGLRRIGWDDHDPDGSGSRPAQCQKTRDRERPAAGRGREAGNLGRENSHPSRASDGLDYAGALSDWVMKSRAV